MKRAIKLIINYEFEWNPLHSNWKWYVKCGRKRARHDICVTAKAATATLLHWKPYMTIIRFYFSYLTDFSLFSVSFALFPLGFALIACHTYQCSDLCSNMCHYLHIQFCLLLSTAISLYAAAGGHVNLQKCSGISIAGHRRFGWRFMRPADSIVTVTSIRLLLFSHHFRPFNALPALDKRAS